MFSEPIDQHGLDWFGQQLGAEMEGYAAADVAALPGTNESLLRSVLQKAIRRGDRKFAVSAGAALLKRNPSALWRSLVIVALEDFGLADLPLTAKIIAAGGDEKLRTALGGDQRVLLFLVEKLLSTNCDRVLDAVQRIARGNCWRMIGSIHDDEEFPKDEISQFIEQICDVASRCDGGFGSVIASRCDAVLRRVVVEGFASGSFIEICHWARRLSRSTLPVLLPFVRDAQAQIAVDERVVARLIPPTNIIGGLPSYALDGHTVIGRNVLEQVLATNREVRMLVWDIAPRFAKLSAIGTLLFLVEGSLCARENTDSFSRALQRIAEQYFSCIPAYRLPDGLEVMGRALPMIEHMRRSHWDELDRKARRKGGLKQAAQS